MSRKWLMWAGCGVMVVAGGYLLWSRGYQNILSYGLLLLCPLMHVFMMGGHNHGGHEEHHPHSEPGAQQETAAKQPACH